MEGKTNTESQSLLNDLSSETLLSLGDSHHVDENYEEAVGAYAAALSMCRESEVILKIRTLSHRSAAFYKLQRYQEALEDAENSLALLSAKKPGGLRTSEGEICHFRAGLAAFGLKRYDRAKKLLFEAAQLASLNNRDKNKETYDILIQKCCSKPTAQEDISAVAELSPTEANSTREALNISSSEAVLPSNHQEPSKSNGSTCSPRSTLTGNMVQTPKYQYYQSNKVMTISILEVGVRQEDLTVRFESKYLVIMLRKNGINFTIIAGNLYSEIDVEKSKVVFKEEKVLVKLRKVEHYEWHELMGKGDESNSTKSVKKKILPAENSEDEKALPKVAHSVPKDTNKTRPYASHRDWDAIEKEIVEEAKNEKAEGDEAMNKLFKQIYANASDDTRRAMVKSFQTSGGTVLSTNWDEVKDKDYEKERTAPNGVEWKTWDGEKVPMKDDN